MATISWKLTTGGGFGNAANWVGGVTPGAADTAIITTASNAIITLNASALTIGALNMAATDLLSVGGGSMTVNGTATLAGGLTETSGSVILKGASTISGAVTGTGGTLGIGTGATATASAGGSLNGMTLAGPGALTTGGTFNVANISTVFAGKGLTWNNGGVANVGGIIYFGIASAAETATIVNQAGASFNLTSDAANLTTYYIGGAFTNLGTLAKTGGTGVSSIDSTLTSSGAINVATGTLSLTGGATISGTESGAGVLNVASTVNLNTGASIGGTISVTGGVLNTATSASITGSLVATGGTVAEAKSATLTVSGSSVFDTYTSLAGAGTVATTGTVAVAPTAGTYIFLGGSATWSNSGVANLGGFIYTGLAAGDTGTIVNQAGASFNLLNDAAGTAFYYSSGAITNLGKLAKTGGTGTSSIASTLTSSGAINVATGTLSLTGGATISGTESGAGVLNVASTVNLTTGASIGGTISVTGGVLNASASSAIPGSLVATGGTVAAASGATLTVSGSSVFDTYTSLAGAGTVATTGTVAVAPTAGTYIFLGGSATWSNSGVANLGGFIYTGLAAGDTGTIVNQAGASFNLLNDAAGTAFYYSSGAITNLGTLAKTGGTGISHIYAAVASTGTISAVSGALELDGGATLSGAIGSTTGGSVRLASTGTSSGTLTILDNSASVSFAVAASATLTNSGTVLDAGVFTVGTAGTTGSLTNAAGAVFNLTSNDASWSGNATVANAGTIAKTGGTGLSTINLAISNTGLIDAAVGTLRLNNTVNGASGTIRVDAGATLEITGLAASVGAKQTIAFNGAGATLKLDKPITFTLPLSGFGIGSRIDLVGQSVTSAVISGATLTVTPSVGSVLTYVSSASLTGDLVGLTSDGAGGTFVGLYRGAVAGAHTPEPLAFGSVHVGAAAIQAVGISNTAVADGYSEALDASLSTASTGFTVAGTLTGLGAGKSDSSTLKVTLKTATAGAVSGTATLALSSDGTGIDGRGITALASQTVNVTGAVYAFAQPSVPSPVVNLGVARVGGAALTGSASVVNTSVAPGYQESLIYAAGSTPASLSVSNGGGTIVAGGTASLGITLGTALAGDFTGTQVPVAMTSTGTGTSGLANTALTSGTLTANGKIYAPAVGQTSAGSIDLGVWHVGDSATAKTLGITNAATGTLTDLLTAGTATLGGSYTGAVTETIAAGGIAPGGSGSVSFGLSTATAGLQTGTVTLGFGSHDADLTDIAAAGVPVTVTGAVDNYAISTPISVSGPALTGSGTSYVLNLGTVQIPGTAGVTNTVTANFGVQNSAAVLADLLSGGWTISGANVASFTNTGFVNFSGLGAGQSETAQSVGLSATSVSTAGTFKEILVLAPAGSNASGYSGVLASETITVTGTLVSLTGQTITLTKAPDIATGGAGNDVFSAAGSTLNSRDQLDGAGGVNTLVLTGAGMYDLGAPKVLANIQVVTATEGQITGGGLADTTQTVYLRDGLDVTVNVAAGTPAAGNTQPESITIYGGTGNDIINLSTGKDTVVIGGTGEVVNGGSGTSLVQATAALSTAKVVGAGSGSLATTLELTTGGTATLNAATNNVIVKLDAATNLTLNSMQFITAIGQVAGNTITAGASGQILGGTAGGDTLIGYTGFGTIFKGTSAGLSGDTIQNWGGTDSVDLTDMAFASLKALTYTAGTGNGVLTVKDGTHTDKLTFTGTFALHNFTAVSDGGTGTLINWHV